MQNSGFAARLFLILTGVIVLSEIGCSPATVNNAHLDVITWQKERNRLDSILRQLPGDFEKTSFLRDYCGSLIDIGRPDLKTAELYRSLTFDSLELYHFYPLFKKDSIPAECGITSYFYIKLVQSFGYKAYQYSFGFTDPPYTRFIHSFPVVEINYNGAKRLIVQDPYLSLTFRNAAEEPMDFYDFLSKLKQKKFNEIKLDSEKVWTKLLIPDTLQYWPYLNDSCRQLMRSHIILTGGKMLRKIPLCRNYQTLMESPCDNFEQGFVQAMQVHGYNEPFIYAYTLRVNEMAGSADVKTIGTKIDSVLSDTVINKPF